MCGIMGFHNLNLSIDKLLDAQIHRGPDARGSCEITVHENSKLVLGHNRLKIVCLSDIANQPFVDTSKQHHLVFNGEIYNYHEIRSELLALGVNTVTHSDTEVLLLALKAWGIKAIHKLNGMFAFAYYDSEHLYLVRDRFGVKPLYYYFQNNQIFFSSTSTIIAETFQLKPNYSYLQHGIQYGIYQDNSEITAYDNLYSVAAGHYVRFTLGETCHKSDVEYYNLESRLLANQSLLTDTSQFGERVYEMLYDSVHLRLQADVPVAVSMSGGLDSSIIAALSKRIKNELVGFSFGSLEDKASEASLAQQTADLNKLDLIFVNADVDEWYETLLDTIKYQDAPFCGLSIVAQFLLYKKIKEHGVKVVLGGQGGDESFLGYRKFQLIYLKELVENRRWGQALGFLSGFSKMLWSEKSNYSKFWQLRNKYTKAGGFNSSLVLTGNMNDSQIGFNQGIKARQIADIIRFSLPTLLRYEDRNSMAHSIESRLPFMDYRLIELACSLPPEVLLKNGYGKWILRDHFKGLIPEEIRMARYKRGFDVSKNKQIMSQLMNKLSGKFKEIEGNLGSSFKIDMEVYSKSKTELSTNQFTELMTLLWLNEKL